MAKIRASRTAQYPLVATFTFNFSDTADDLTGVEKSFNVTGSPKFRVISLPPNAIVVGGNVAVETAYNTTSTATVSLGDADSANRYASAVNIKTAAITALTLPAFRTSGNDLELTVALADAAATQGKVTVHVMYLIADRANEVQAN